MKKTKAVILNKKGAGVYIENNKKKVYWNLIN